MPGIVAPYPAAAFLARRDLVNAVDRSAAHRPVVGCKAVQHEATPSEPLKQTSNEVLFVVNPAGRNGRNAQDWSMLSRDIQSKLGSRFQVREALTDGPRHAEALALEAAQRGAYAVVAVGGDGTINEVANGLLTATHGPAASPNPVAPIMATPCAADENPTALAVLPFGTGSDFVRSFQWGGDAASALERVARGRRVAIDAGRVECCSGPGQRTARYFVNIASCGLSARAASHMDAFKWLGGLGYTLAAAQAFLTHRNAPCLVTATTTTATTAAAGWASGGSGGGDGRGRQEQAAVLETIQGIAGHGSQQLRPMALARMTLLAVANGQYFGGGMRIAPDADPADGRFQVVAIYDKSMLDFVVQKRHLLRGTHIEEGLLGVTAMDAEHVEVQPMDIVPDKRMYFELDGEVVGYAPGAIDLLQGALQVLI